MNKNKFNEYNMIGIPKFILILYYFCLAVFGSTVDLFAHEFLERSN